MHHYCPECEKRNKSDYNKYGFNIVKDAKYWTIIKEVKTCCPVKVTLVDYNSTNVILEIDGKQYTKQRDEFMKTSWRDYEAY